MRKVSFVAGLLFCLGALSHAADAPKSIPSEKTAAAQTTITFGKGTTVLVNGQPVESGYQLKKGDKLSVSGGTAEITYQTYFGTRTRTLNPGATVEIGQNESSKGLVDVHIDDPVAKTSLMSQTAVSSLALPPPSPQQEISVVSPSAP